MPETSIGDIEKAINDLGYGTPEYHEAMGYYGLMIARSQWRLADLARRRQDRKVKTKAGDG